MHEHELFERPVFVILFGLCVYCFASNKSVSVVGERLGAVSVDVPWELITKNNVSEGTLMVLFPVLVSTLGDAIKIGSVVLFEELINISTTWSPHLDCFLGWHVMSIPIVREPIVQDSINLLGIPSISHSCCQWFKWSSCEVTNYRHEFLMDIFEAGSLHGKLSSPSSNVWIICVVNIENKKIESLSTKLEISNSWLITDEIILSLKLCIKFPQNWRNFVN